MPGSRRTSSPFARNDPSIKSHIFPGRPREDRASEATWMQSVGRSPASCSVVSAIYSMQHSFCHQKSSEGFHRSTTVTFSSLLKWRTGGGWKLYSESSSFSRVTIARCGFPSIELHLMMRKMRSTPTIRGTPVVRRGSRISIPPSILTCES